MSLSVSLFCDDTSSVDVVLSSDENITIMPQDNNGNNSYYDERVIVIKQQLHC